MIDHVNQNTICITNRFGYGVSFTSLHRSDSLLCTNIGVFIAAITGMHGYPGGSSVCLASEGSFSEVWSNGLECARFTRVREGPAFLERIRYALECIKSCSFVKYIHDYGYMVDSNGHELGFLVVMEHLDPIRTEFGDESSIFLEVSRISELGFHNDLKIDNIMYSRHESRVCVIDFDLFSPTKLTIALSGTSFIELDIAPFLSKLSDPDSFIKVFRLYYDYTCLSLSINKKHGLFVSVLARLVSLFNELESDQQHLLTKLKEFLGEEKVRDIPVEVLVRCPDGVDGVSVNFFDLKGNAFAHGLSDWELYPSLFKSTGVYWPNR